MSQLPDLKEIMMLAIVAYKYAVEKTGEEKSCSSSRPDDFEPLKCETCPAKEYCEVRNVKDKIESGNIVSELMNTLGNILRDHDPDHIPTHMRNGNFKPKGEC